MRNSGLRLIECIWWVLIVSTTIVSASLLISVLVGKPLLTLKYILFVVGVLLFGIGSIGLQPKRPHRDEKWFTVDSDSEYSFEESIQNLPPLKGEKIPIETRISRNVKIFVVSLILLLLSFLLEFSLDITFGTV